MRKFTKRAATIATATAVAAGAAGVGFAYWSTNGSGSGTANTSTGAGTSGAAVSIATSSATPISAMYPGDSAQALKATVSNTDANQKVYVSNVYAYLTVTQAQGAPGTCDSTDYLLNGVSGTTAQAVTNNNVTTGGPVQLHWTAQELNAKGITGTAAPGSYADTNGGDSIQFNDKASNQDGCKGAVVTIHYTSN